MKVSRWSEPWGYSAEQLFDLAAGIEDYPRFLRGWLEARILERTEEGCRVEQVLGIGPMHLRFGSRAVFRRPERIEVTSDDPPFRAFGLTWRIEPAAGGCRVGIETEVALRSRLAQPLVDRALPGAVVEILAAFEARARQLYTESGRELKGSS